MKNLSKIISALVFCLATFLYFAPISEAKYLSIVFMQDARGHGFYNEGNKKWTTNHIKYEVLTQIADDSWTIDHRTINEFGDYDSLSEVAKKAGNWDPNAYVLFVYIDECFVNHVDFNNWRTGHVDVKDLFVGINTFLYSGYGEDLYVYGRSKRFPNKTGDTDTLLDALYRKCFKDAWEFYMEHLFPWRINTKEEYKGNYTEDYL